MFFFFVRIVIADGEIREMSVDELNRKCLGVRAPVDINRRMCAFSRENGVGCGRKPRRRGEQKSGVAAVGHQSVLL